MIESTHLVAESAPEPPHPLVRHPWRRFFARTLDLSLYRLLWMCILSLILGVNLSNRGGLWTFLDVGISVLVMVFLEPLLLSRFGTTLGKWMMGLSIAYPDGSKISYRDGLDRTVCALWRGMAFSLIPFYNLYRLWKSYQSCKAGKTLDWEYTYGHSPVLTLKDASVWRIVSFVGVHILSGIAIALLLIFELNAPNRGDITLEEFAENYNYYEDYYYLEPSRMMQADGTWGPTDYGVYYYSNNAHVDFQFTQEDGVITGVSFTIHMEDWDSIVNGPYSEMVLSTIALLRAQESVPLLSATAQNEVIEAINDQIFESFTISSHGLTITNEVSFEGYSSGSNSFYLWPEDEAEVYCYQHYFEIMKH